MELNMLNGAQGDLAMVPTDVSAKRFWQVYLALLEVRGMTLTPKERDVLVYVLVRPASRDYFSSPLNKGLMRDLRMSKSELSRMKKRLISKGLINESDQLLTRALHVLQHQVNRGRELAFVYPMRVKDEREEREEEREEEEAEVRSLS